jgi:uncharacterized protein YrzB (UPF0473 family)
MALVRRNTMDFDERDNLTEDGAEIAADLITLTDEEGVDHEFELIDTLEFSDSTYVALIASPEDPSEYLEDDGNLVIMRIVDEDGEEVLELIEDDDEFETVSEMFMDRLSDLYDFEEDEDD